MSVKRPLRALVAMLLIPVLTVLSGCGADGSGTGTDAPIVIGTTGVTKNLDPLKSSWSITSIGVGEYVYMLNENGELTSRFVESATQDSDLEWTLTLKKGAKFSDGSDVDAQALADSLNQIQEGNARSNASAGKIKFTAEGDVLKAQTERVTRVLPSVLGEWSNIVFKTLDDGSHVFTGPYQVAKFESGQFVELEPNQYYPDAEKRSPVTVKAFADTDAMKLAIQSNSIDMAFTITPAVAEQLADSDGITVKTIEAGYQYFARPNLTSGPTADDKVREAIDLALDRGEYVKALQGGKPATGFFASYYSFAGKESVDSDMAAAKQVLDEAGWKPGTDGIREKDGQRLSIKIITYPSRPDLGIIMQVMVSQLKEVGIEATTAVVDDISGAVKSGDYGIAMWAQHTAPTGEPAFFLNQFFRTDGANNLNGYSSPTTDALLDELADMPAGSERDAKAVEVQAQVRADRAALLLVDPQWHVAVSDRLQDYQPYCGDYYIVNADLSVG